MLTVVSFPNSILYLAENWMRDTVLFVLRNRKLDMLDIETQPKLFMWANFIGQKIFNVSPWTRSCPTLYTHKTHQPNCDDDLHPSCIKIL